jgi:hypothetical protein
MLPYSRCPLPCLCNPTILAYLYLFDNSTSMRSKSHLHVLWHSLLSTLAIFISHAFFRGLFAFFFTDFLRSFSCIIAVERRTLGCGLLSNF